MSKKIFKKFLFAAVVPFSLGLGFLASSAFNSFSSVKSLQNKQKSIDEIEKLLSDSTTSVSKASSLGKEVLTNKVPVLNSYKESSDSSKLDTLALNAKRLFNPGYILMDDNPVATGSDGKLEPMTIKSSWEEIVDDSELGSEQSISKSFTIQPYEDTARDIKHKYLSTFKKEVLDLNVGDNIIPNDGSAYYEGRIDLAYLLNNASTSVFEVDNTKNRQLSRITPDQPFTCYYQFPYRCQDSTGNYIYYGIQDFNIDNGYGANKPLNFSQTTYLGLTPSEWNKDLLNYDPIIGWSLLQPRAAELNYRAYEEGFNTLDSSYIPEKFSSKTNLNYALNNISYQRGINFRIADTSKSQTLFTAFSKSAYSSAYPSTLAKNDVEEINSKLPGTEEKEPLLDFRFNNIYNRYSGVKPGNTSDYPYFLKGENTKKSSIAGYMNLTGLYDFFVNENDRSNASSHNWFNDYINYSDSFVSLIYNHVTNKIELVTGTNDAIADLNYDNLGVAIFASKLDVVSTRDGELDTNIFDIKARHNTISTENNLNSLGKVNKIRFYGTPKAASKVLKPFYGNSFNSQYYAKFKAPIYHNAGIEKSELLNSRGWAKNGLYGYSSDFGIPSVGYLPSNFENITYNKSTSSFSETRRLNNAMQLSPDNLNTTIPECKGNSNICLPGADFIHPDTRSSLLSELSFLDQNGKNVSYSISEFNSNLMNSSKDPDTSTISYTNTSEYESFLSDITTVLSNGSHSLFQSKDKDSQLFIDSSGTKVSPTLSLVSFSTFSPANVSNFVKGKRGNGSGWLAMPVHGNIYDEYTGKGASNSSDETSLSDYFEITLDRPVSLKEIQMSINTIEHDAKWPRIEVDSEIEYMSENNVLEKAKVSLYAEEVAISNIDGSVLNPVINNTNDISYYKNDSWKKFINTKIREASSNPAAYNYAYLDKFQYGSLGQFQKNYFWANQSDFGKDNLVTYDDLKRSIDSFDDSNVFSNKVIGKIKTDWYILDKSKTKNISKPSEYADSNSNISFYTLQITNKDSNYDMPSFRSQWNNRFFKSQDSQIKNKYSIALSNPDNQEYYNSIVMPKVKIFAKKKDNNPTNLVQWIDASLNFDEIDELLVSKKDKLLSNSTYDNFYTSDLSYKLNKNTISNLTSISSPRTRASEISIIDALGSSPIQKDAFNKIADYLVKNNTSVIPQSLIRDLKILESKPMEGQSSLFSLDSKFRKNGNYEVYATRRRNSYNEFKSNLDYDKYIRSNITKEISNDSSPTNQIWQLYTNRSDKYITNEKEYIFGDVKDERKGTSGSSIDYNNRNSNVTDITYATFLKPMSIYKDPYGSVLLGQTTPNMPLLLDNNTYSSYNKGLSGFWFNSSSESRQQFSPFSFGTSIKGESNSWNPNDGPAESYMPKFFFDDDNVINKSILGKNRFYYGNNQYIRVLDPIDPSVTLGYVKAGLSSAQFSSLITSGDLNNRTRERLYSDSINSFSGIQLSNLKNLRSVYKDEDLIYSIQKEEEYNYQIFPKGNKKFSNNIVNIKFKYEVDPLPFDKPKFLDNNTYLLGSKTDDSLHVRYNIEETTQDLSNLKEISKFQIYGYSSNFEKASQLLDNPSPEILSGMDSYSSYNLWNNIPIYNLSIISSKTNSDISRSADISIDISDFMFEIKQGNVEIWVGNEKINPLLISEPEYSELKLNGKVLNALKSNRIESGFKLKIADGRTLFHESSSKLMIPIINFNFGNTPESIKNISYSAFDNNLPVYGPLKLKATNKYGIEYSTNSLNINGMQTYDINETFNSIILGNKKIEWDRFNGYNSIKLSDSSNIFNENFKCLSDEKDGTCSEREIKQKVVTGAYIDFPRASYVDVMDAAKIFNTFNTSNSAASSYPWPGSVGTSWAGNRLQSNKASTLLSSFIMKELLFYSKEQQKMISNGIGNYSDQYQYKKKINSWQKLTSDQQQKLTSDIFDIEKNNNPWLLNNNSWTTQTNWIDTYYRSNIYKQNLGFEDNRDLPINTYINAYGVSRDGLDLYSNTTQMGAHWDFIPSYYVGYNNFINNLNNNFYNSVSSQNSIRSQPLGPSYNLYDFDKAYSIYNFETDGLFHSFSNSGGINSGLDSLLSYISPESKEAARYNLKDLSLSMGSINNSIGNGGYADSLSQSIQYASPLVNEFISLNYSVSSSNENINQFADPSKQLNESALRMFIKFEKPLSEFPAAAFRTGLLNSKLGGVKIDYEAKEMTTTTSVSILSDGTEQIIEEKKELSSKRDLYSLNDKIVTFNRTNPSVNPFSSINSNPNYFDYSKSEVFTDLYDKIFNTAAKTGLSWVNNNSNKEISNFHNVYGDNINSSIPLASFDASSVNLNDVLRIDLPSYFMFSNFIINSKSDYINSLPSILKGITNSKKQDIVDRINSGNYEPSSSINIRGEYGIGRIESEDDYSGSNGISNYLRNIVLDRSGVIVNLSKQDSQYANFSKDVSVKDFLYNKLIPLESLNYNSSGSLSYSYYDDPNSNNRSSLTPFLNLSYDSINKKYNISLEYRRNFAWHYAFMFKMKENLKITKTGSSSRNVDYDVLYSNNNFSYDYGTFYRSRSEVFNKGVFQGYSYSDMTDLRLGSDISLPDKNVYGGYFINSGKWINGYRDISSNEWVSGHYENSLWVPGTYDEVLTQLSNRYIINISNIRKTYYPNAMIPNFDENRVVNSQSWMNVWDSSLSNGFYGIGFTNDARISRVIPKNFVINYSGKLDIWLPEFDDITQKWDNKQVINVESNSNNNTISSNLSNLASELDKFSEKEIKKYVRVINPTTGAKIDYDASSPLNLTEDQLTNIQIVYKRFNINPLSSNFNSQIKFNDAAGSEYIFPFASSNFDIPILSYGDSSSTTDLEISAFDSIKELLPVYSDNANNTNINYIGADGSGTTGFFNALLPSTTFSIQFFSIDTDGNQTVWGTSANPSKIPNNLKNGNKLYFVIRPNQGYAFNDSNFDSGTYKSPIYSIPSNQFELKYKSIDQFTNSPISPIIPVGESEGRLYQGVNGYGYLDDAFYIFMFDQYREMIEPNFGVVVTIKSGTTTRTFKSGSLPSKEETKLSNGDEIYISFKSKEGYFFTYKDSSGNDKISNFVDLFIYKVPSNYLPEPNSVRLSNFHNSGSASTSKISISTNPSLNANNPGFAYLFATTDNLNLDQFLFRNDSIKIGETDFRDIFHFLFLSKKIKYKDANGNEFNVDNPNFLGDELYNKIVSNGNILDISLNVKSRQNNTPVPQGQTFELEDLTKGNFVYSVNDIFRFTVKSKIGMNGIEFLIPGISEPQEEFIVEISISELLGKEIISVNDWERLKSNISASKLTNKDGEFTDYFKSIILFMTQRDFETESTNLTYNNNIVSSYSKFTNFNYDKLNLKIEILENNTSILDRVITNSSDAESFYNERFNKLTANPANLITVNEKYKFKITPILKNTNAYSFLLFSEQKTSSVEALEIDFSISNLNKPKTLDIAFLDLSTLIQESKGLKKYSRNYSEWLTSIPNKNNLFSSSMPSSDYKLYLTSSTFNDMIELNLSNSDEFRIAFETILSKDAGYDLLGNPLDINKKIKDNSKKFYIYVENNNSSYSKSDYILYEYDFSEDLISFINFSPERIDKNDVTPSIPDSYPFNNDVFFKVSSNYSNFSDNSNESTWRRMNIQFNTLLYHSSDKQESILSLTKNKAIVNNSSRVYLDARPINIKKAVMTVQNNPLITNENIPDTLITSDPQNIIRDYSYFAYMYQSVPTIADIINQSGPSYTNSATNMYNAYISEPDMFGTTSAVSIDFKRDICGELVDPTLEDDGLGCSNFGQVFSDWESIISDRSNMPVKGLSGYGWLDWELYINKLFKLNDSDLQWVSNKTTIDTSTSSPSKDRLLVLNRILSLYNISFSIKDSTGRYYTYDGNKSTKNIDLQITRTNIDTGNRIDFNDFIVASSTPGQMKELLNKIKIDISLPGNLADLKYLIKNDYIIDFNISSEPFYFINPDTLEESFISPPVTVKKKNDKGDLEDTAISNSDLVNYFGSSKYTVKNLYEVEDSNNLSNRFNPVFYGYYDALTYASDKNNYLSYGRAKIDVLPLYSNSFDLNNTKFAKSDRSEIPDESEFKNLTENNYESLSKDLGIREIKNETFVFLRWQPVFQNSSPVFMPLNLAPASCIGDNVSACLDLIENNLLKQYDPDYIYFTNGVASHLAAVQNVQDKLVVTNSFNVQKSILPAIDHVNNEASKLAYDFESNIKEGIIEKDTSGNMLFANKIINDSTSSSRIKIDSTLMEIFDFQDSSGRTNNLFDSSKYGNPFLMQIKITNSRINRNDLSDAISFNLNGQENILNVVYNSNKANLEFYKDKIAEKKDYIDLKELGVNGYYSINFSISSNNKISVDSKVIKELEDMKENIEFLPDSAEVIIYKKEPKRKFSIFTYLKEPKNTFISSDSSDSRDLISQIGGKWKSEFLISDSPLLVPAYSYKLSSLTSNDKPENKHAVPMINYTLDNGVFMAWGVTLVSEGASNKFYGSASNVDLPDTLFIDGITYNKAKSFNDLRISNTSTVKYYLLYKAPNTDLYIKDSTGSNNIINIDVLPNSFLNLSGTNTLYDQSSDPYNPSRLFVIKDSSSTLNLLTRLKGKLSYNLENMNFEAANNKQGQDVGLAYHQNAILKIRELLSNYIDKISLEDFFINETDKDLSAYSMLDLLNTNNWLNSGDINIQFFENSSNPKPIQTVNLTSWNDFIDWNSNPSNIDKLSYVENGSIIRIEISMDNSSKYFFTNSFKDPANSESIKSDINNKKPLVIELKVNDKSLRKISPIDKMKDFLQEALIDNSKKYRLTSLEGSTNNFRLIDKDVVRSWTTLLNTLQTDFKLIDSNWSLSTDSGSSVIRNFEGLVNQNNGIELPSNDIFEKLDLVLNISIKETDYSMWSREVQILQDIKDQLENDGIIIDFGANPNSRTANIRFTQSLKSNLVKIVYDRYKEFETGIIKAEFYSVTLNEANKNNIYMKFKCDLIDNKIPYFCNESYWTTGDSITSSPKFSLDDLFFSDGSSYDFGSINKNEFFTNLFNPSVGVSPDKGFSFNNSLPFYISIKSNDPYIFEIGSPPTTKATITFFSNQVIRSYQDTYTFPFNPFMKWTLSGKSGNSKILPESESWQNLLNMYNDSINNNKPWLRDENKSTIDITITSNSIQKSFSYVFGSINSNGDLLLKIKGENTLKSLSDISQEWKLKNGDIINTNFGISTLFPGYAINSVNQNFSNTLSQFGFSYVVEGLQEEIKLEDFKDVNVNKPLEFFGYDGEISLSSESSLIKTFEKIRSRDDSISFYFYDLEKINIDDLSQEYVEPSFVANSLPNSITSKSRYAFIVAPKNDSYYIGNVPSDIPFETIKIKDKEGNDKSVLIYTHNSTSVLKPEGEYAIKLFSNRNRIVQFPESISVDQTGNISLFYSSPSGSKSILSLEEYLSLIFNNNSLNQTVINVTDILEISLIYYINGEKKYADISNIYGSLKNSGLDKINLYIEVSIKKDYQNLYTFVTNYIESGVSKEQQIYSFNSRDSKILGLNDFTYSYEITALNNSSDDFIRDTIMSDSSDFYNWFNIFPSQIGLIPFYTVKNTAENGYMFRRSSYFDLILSVTDTSDITTLYEPIDIQNSSITEIPITNKLSVLFIPKYGNLINYKSYHSFESPTSIKPVSLPPYYGNKESFSLIVNGLNGEGIINSDWILEGQEAKWTVKRNGEIISTSIGSVPINIKNGDIVTVAISLKVDKNLIYYWDSEEPIIASRLIFTQEINNLAEKQEGQISTYKNSYLVGSISAFILFIPFAIGLKALIVLRKNKKEEEL